MDEDLFSRLRSVEKTSTDNAIAVERAAADAREAKADAAEVHPLIMARSGDEQRRDRFETNVNQAHEKLRDHHRRLTRVEKWIERIAWIGIGIVAAGQALWWLVSRIIEKGAE